MNERVITFFYKLGTGVSKLFLFFHFLRNLSYVMLYVNKFCLKCAKGRRCYMLKGRQKQLKSER